MDYEKKYNEAIERMRKMLGPWRELAYNGKTFLQDLEYIFPELHKSEDERIRRSLVDYFEHYNPKDKWDEEFSFKDVLDYLEKQKDRMAPVYDNQDSFESALEKAWNDYHNGYENVDKLEDDYVECAHAKGFREGYLFGIEKQKEQKPVDYDHEMWKNCVANFEGGKKEVIEHPEKYGLQKPAEWSEEDADMLNCCISSIEEAKENRYAYKETDGDTSYDREIAWLKSLRPSWKPSDEEMKALDVACSGKLWYGEIYLNGLRRIREQLKKL